MSEKAVFNYKRYINALKERDRLREENKKLQLEACKLMQNEVDMLRKENEALKQQIIILQIKNRSEKENHLCV